MIFFEDNFPSWLSGVNFKKLVTFNAGFNVTTGFTLQLNGLPIPTSEYVTSGPWSGGASPGASILVNGTAQPIYTAPNDSTTWKITQISARTSTPATAAATLNVEVATAGTAPGSGTNQMSSAIPIGSGATANTTANGTVTTQTTISAGTSVNLVPGGAATTTMAGLVVTIVLQRQTQFLHKQSEYGTMLVLIKGMVYATSIRY